MSLSGTASFTVGAQVQFDALEIACGTDKPTSASKQIHYLFRLQPNAEDASRILFSDCRLICSEAAGSSGACLGVVRASGNGTGVYMESCSFHHFQAAVLVEGGALAKLSDCQAQLLVGTGDVEIPQVSSFVKVSKA